MFNWTIFLSLVTSSTDKTKARDKNDQHPSLISWMPLSNFAYLKHIQNLAVAYVIPQPKEQYTSKRGSLPSVIFVKGYSGYTRERGRGRGGGKRNGKKITAVELTQAMLTNPCRRCGKVGH